METIYFKKKIWDCYVLFHFLNSFTGMSWMYSLQIHWLMHSHSQIFHCMDSSSQIFHFSTNDKKWKTTFFSRRADNNRNWWYIFINISYSLKICGKRDFKNKHSYWITKTILKLGKYQVITRSFLKVNKIEEQHMRGDQKALDWTAGPIWIWQQQKPSSPLYNKKGGKNI